MSDELLRLAREAAVLALLVSAPALIAALTVGLLARVLPGPAGESVTLLPRLVAVGLVLVALGPTLGARVVRFAADVFAAIPALN